ncbi:MAG: HEPN domain-containing protein [Thermoguttaceae bacterium]|jgi:hypothetical protein
MTYSDDERQHLVTMRLAKSDFALADASMLAEHGSPLGAINRCYYAMFHAVSALAIHDNVDLHKHSAIIAWFHREYVKTGRFSQASGKSLQQAFLKRCSADYEDAAIFDSGQVKALLEEAIRFASEIKAVLQGRERPA